MLGHGQTELLSLNWIIIQMLEPDCFLRYCMRCNVEFYYVGKIPTYAYWPVAATRRGFKTFLFTTSCGNTFVGGTCALPSAF